MCFLLPRIPREKLPILGSLLFVEQEGLCLGTAPWDCTLGLHMYIHHSIKEQVAA